MNELAIAALIALHAGPTPEPSTGPPAPPGWNDAAAKATAKSIQRYYNKTKDFKAKFKHVYSKRFHRPEAPRWGYMWVMKPGRMRWDYATPRKKQLIVDGQKLWISVPEDKQVFWRSIQRSALPSAVSFLWGKGDLLSDFHVKTLKTSKYARPGASVIKLQPKTPNANYKHILFVVEAKSGMVLETVVYEHLGNKNQYTFMKAKQNTGVTQALFTFKPPAGYRVIKATDDVRP